MPEVQKIQMSRHGPASIVKTYGLRLACVTYLSQHLKSLHNNQGDPIRTSSYKDLTSGKKQFYQQKRKYSPNSYQSISYD